MIGERREARTKNQAQVFHRNVDVKGHSQLLAVPFNIGATNIRLSNISKSNSYSEYCLLSIEYYLSLIISLFKWVTNICCPPMLNTTLYMPPVLSLRT